MLVRHPETEANTTLRWVGRGNSALTDLGEEQVAYLVDAIVRFEPEAIYCSPLERAAIPAEQAASDLGIEAVVDDRLIELDFGQAEGLTTEEAVERGIRFEFKSQDEPVAPGGESRREILERTMLALEEITGAHRRAAVVTHGGVFRSGMVSLLDLPIAAIWSFHIQNAQIARIAIGDDWTRLEEFYQAGPRPL